MAPIAKYTQNTDWHVLLDEVVDNIRQLSRKLKNIPFVLASLLLRIQYKVLLVLVALLLKDFKWDNTYMKHLWMSYLKAMESEDNYSW